MKGEVRATRPLSSLQAQTTERGSHSDVLFRQQLSSRGGWGVTHGTGPLGFLPYLTPSAVYSEEWARRVSEPDA